jgi:hypothetical protein
MIPLAAGEYHLYTDVRLETPNMGTGLDDIPVESFPALLVYPNPARDRIIISRISESLSSPSEKKHSIEIVDLAGCVAQSQAWDPQVRSVSMDISALKAGAYLIVVKENGKIMYWNKVMVME